MVDFAGWGMPVYYTSIVDEHLATRRTAGLFDISHMGRLRFDGPDAAPFLDRLLTRRVLGMEPGRIRYSLITNEIGGILDDVLIYHLKEPDGRSYHLLVVNASNREKIVAWVDRILTGAQNTGLRDIGLRDIGFRDISMETAMIAVQGPQAISAATPFVGCDINQLEYYTGTISEVCGQSSIVSRTGYTGEDGCELIVPAEHGLHIWQQILAEAELCGGSPVGLGARDTLRLEAAMPLYGHELSEQINPYQAGLSFAVNLKGRDFVGQAALLKFKEDEKQDQRVGLELPGKRIPREHYPVTAGGELIGQVSSGTFSPTLERPIAMAYVRPQYAGLGTELAIDIRGRPEPARVVALPFYSRTTR